MTIESSRMQIPTAAPNPLMNVQHEVQKGLQDNDKSPVSAGAANKQMVAGLSTPQRQTPQQVVSDQVSKGYLDIKI
ncbi:hypothetical protein SDC9_192876 [bioreactor metagenome]|uniref:Uncharacterized protein n=1 Tax=bioreactor metagenome TaxID=1076179 RepID=A0A645I4D2_9ZZZZ